MASYFFKAVTSTGGIRTGVLAGDTETSVSKELRRQGLTPVRYLHSLGVLDPSTCAVHAVWVDDEEISLIAAKGSTVSHNPESNMKLASGISPVPELLARGITVGLGTDGCASNNNLDLFEEMDMAAKLHKVGAMGAGFFAQS